MSESTIVNGLFWVAGALCAAWLVWGALLCLGEWFREAMAFRTDALRHDVSSDTPAAAPRRLRIPTRSLKLIR